MAYTKQTWTDGSDGGTPVSAARLSHMEDGIWAATESATLSVDSYGADPTGATFSDTAVAAARTALGSNPGTIQFGPGNYKLTSTLTLGPYQSATGDNGLGSTVLHYSGTGACIRVQDTRASAGPAAALPGGAGGPGYGGAIANLTIDGTGAGASAIGIHAGDMTGLTIDVALINFTGASAIGIWLDNRVTWFEDATVHARFENCKNTVIFDAGNGGFPSFGYGRYNFFTTSYENQNGPILRNGAYVYNLREPFTLTGGFLNASGSGTNTGAVMTVADTSTFAGTIDVNVEASGTTGLGHKTIVVANTAQFRFMGRLEFITGGISFANGSFSPAQVTGAGRVNVDGVWGRLGAPQHALRVMGGMTRTRGSLGTNGDLSISGGNVFKAQMLSGAQTITLFDVPTVQAGEFDLFIQQPASGSTTLTWPAGFTWLAGSAPTLSTTTNAIDHIHVTTPDFVTFYAEHVNAARPAQSVTTNPSTLSVDAFNEFLGSSPITTTLPAATKTGRPVILKNVSTAVVTVNRAGSDIIHYDNSSKASLSVPPGAALTLISDGFEWSVVSSVVPSPRIDTVASSATPAINVSTTDQFNITALAVNITSMTSGLTGTAADGQQLDIRITGTAARTITWGASFQSSGVNTLLATTATTKTHLSRFKYDSIVAKWVCFYVDATGY